MDQQMKNALGEGLVDALGFIAGGLAGGMLARALGFDFLGEQGWGGASIAGILCVGLGAGLGKTLARRLLRREPPPAAPSSSAGRKR
jgi:hypothetical protein